MTERLYCEDCAFFKQEEKEMGYCYAECGKRYVVWPGRPACGQFKAFTQMALEKEKLNIERRLENL